MKKPKKKYPSLWGCYVDEGFTRSYTRKYLQARVQINHYKGHMLLSVPDPNATNGSGVALSGDAWLDGDDLDAVIAMLRDAKRVWLKAYRRAVREVARRDRERKKAGRK
jgi:hypothetical protein